MARRLTCLTRLSNDDARREVAEALELVGGNVVRAAHVLSISRRQLYRYLWGVPGLWADADRVRAAAMTAFLAARARLGVESGAWKKTGR